MSRVLRDVGEQGKAWATVAIAVQGTCEVSIHLDTARVQGVHCDRTPGASAIRHANCRGGVGEPSGPASRKCVSFEWGPTRVTAVCGRRAPPGLG
ncbi:hypothetical protein ElyMa_000850200 [Elysia marginata]|uniref:Uncharacterized protein n=1 Tax=Elysia marginata TaxID=1093978 RepID=A0AAV4H4G0_9GAST|nr:hypothetical protein ElyMa_000850200 [Elysia marginata]